MKDIYILKFIHIILALLWIYQGLIPKLLFISTEEIAVWKWLGLPDNYAKLAGQGAGIAEIIFGLSFIFLSMKILHYINILGLLFLLILIAIVLPNTLISAFNPVVMNIAMISLSCIFLMLYRPILDK